MMRRFLLGMVLTFAQPAFADVPDIEAIVETHVLPRYQTLAAETAVLAEVALADCSVGNADLTTAYHDAFDAWVGVSHLRFGPSEHDDRAFALAFWPDPRGSTPKALSALIREGEFEALGEENFATASIASRGFYALEFLLFDPQFAGTENKDYHCALTRAVTRDIAVNSTAILQGWEGGYAALMSNANNDTYRSPEEAARQLFTALTTGLEFTSQTRLGRPLGTYDRPRPNRAEARRSGRSLDHVEFSLEATRELARLISDGDEDLENAFDAALARAAALGDPTFAGVADPQRRIRIEVLQQNIDTIRALLAESVGPSLGIAAGFNALDGD